MKPLKQLNQDFFGQGRLLPRLLLLTSLKEGWLFLTNAYGLFFHPRRSLKKIISDRSQLAIFVSLPIGAILVFILALAVIYYIKLLQFNPLKW